MRAFGRARSPRSPSRRVRQVHRRALPLLLRARAEARRRRARPEPHAHRLGVASFLGGSAPRAGARARPGAFAGHHPRRPPGEPRDRGVHAHHRDRRRSRGELLFANRRWRTDANRRGRDPRVARALLRAVPRRSVRRIDAGLADAARARVRDDAAVLRARRVRVERRCDAKNVRRARVRGHQRRRRDGVPAAAAETVEEARRAFSQTPPCSRRGGRRSSAPPRGAPGPRGGTPRSASGGPGSRGTCSGGWSRDETRRPGSLSRARVEQSGERASELVKLDLQLISLQYVRRCTFAYCETVCSMGNLHGTPNRFLEFYLADRRCWAHADPVTSEQGGFQLVVRPVSSAAER